MLTFIKSEISDNSAEIADQWVFFADDAGREYKAFAYFANLPLSRAVKHIVKFNACTETEAEAVYRACEAVYPTLF